MSTKERDERAIDALIVAALRQKATEQEETASDSLLSADDLKAINDLGANLATRVVKGQVKSRKATKSNIATTILTEAPEFASAMNRGGDGGQLTREARQEMERRIRELDNEEEADSKQ